MEIVKIKQSPRTENFKINGLQGTILGFNFVDNEWIYSVDVEGKEELHSIEEPDIVSTGEMDDISNFYDDPTDLMHNE